MTSNINSTKCELPDFDDSHAEIFYSFPFKIEDNYMFQYKVTISGDEFELEEVKSFKDEEEIEEDFILLSKYKPVNYYESKKIDIEIIEGKLEFNTVKVHVFRKKQK